MSLPEVFLLTENPLLSKWCFRELSGEFRCNASLPDVYGHLLNMTSRPSCVIVDWHFCDEQSLLEIYDYIATVLGIPLVLVCTERRPILARRKELFPRAHFLTVYAESGHLLSLLRSLMRPAEFKEKRAAVRQCAERSQRMLGVSAFNRKLERIAQSDEPVLLLGESGSGKSFTARRIHELSALSGPYCSMNVAELSSSLAESQLFGTVRGAFTDATDAPGLFEQAEHGTLLLDEIAELTLPVQSKLLDVIETKRFRRVGSMQELTFNTRLIFATNADLHERARAGLFRPDLLYRIDVLCIHVPPLREHKEDIPRIARECADRRNKSLSPAALDLLCVYPWPGNIRQLCNYVSRACALSHSEVLTAEDFDFL